MLILMNDLNHSFGSSQFVWLTVLSYLCLVIPDETERLKEMWHILRNELPEENFALLKFLMEFLYEVCN